MEKILNFVIIFLKRLNLLGSSEDINFHSDFEPHPFRPSVTTWGIEHACGGTTPKGSTLSTFSYIIIFNPCVACNRKNKMARIQGSGV